MKIGKSSLYWTFYRPLFQLSIKLFQFLPIKKNKVVFIQGDGAGYGCNLKYIAEEIINQGINYDMVWLVNNTKLPMPSAIRKVLFNRIRAVYELSTAHIVINNFKSRAAKCLDQKHMNSGRTRIRMTEGHIMSWLSLKLLYN